MLVTQLSNMDSAVTLLAASSKDLIAGHWPDLTSNAMVLAILVANVVNDLVALVLGMSLGRYWFARSHVSVSVASPGLLTTHEESQVEDFRLSEEPRGAVPLTFVALSVNTSVQPSLS